MGWGKWPVELTTLRSRRRSCPPHGPLMVEAVEEGTYVTRCMRCGLWGPEREDGLQAKEAFDEASKSNGSSFEYPQAARQGRL